MTALAAIDVMAAQDALFVSGALHLTPQDGLDPRFRSLVLLSPAEPGFWAHVTAAPEWADNGADPLDRWSRRVISAMAGQIGAEPLFPFGGPPHRPFIDWALRSGRAWTSPVQLIVQDRMGLMASYRGALAVTGHVDLPEPAQSPCDTCAGKPCLTACPPRALTGAGYDIAACHAFLDGTDGKTCLMGGCAVRRACPLSQSYGRLAGQSAYHMRLFHT